MSQSRFTADTMALMKSALGSPYADRNLLNKASVSTASGLTFYDLRAPSLLLTPLNLTPLVDRTPRKNKGGGAAEAALHLIALTHRFLKKTKGIGFKPASEHILMAGQSKDKNTA